MDHQIFFAAGDLLDLAKSTGEQFGFQKQLFFSQVISFCVVCFLLHRFAYKPILKVLEDRRQRIAEGLACSGCGVMMSGRVSYDLVAKAARAGLEIVAGVSAPSSLAIDAALQRNITLCGFVREDRVTVFTGPQRITDLVT